MNMIPVRSSAISDFGYDSSSQRMKVKFKQGETYSFCRVPEHIFNGLINSSSKGSYYNNHIRDKYQC